MLEIERFDLEEIGFALQDQTDYEHYHVIDPKTGEILYWTAETGIDGTNPVDLDELDLAVIHPLPSYVWYADMVDFADLLSDDRASRRLSRALEGRGAFRRFKNELHDEYPHLLQAWHAFQDTRVACRAVEWLRDEELISRTAADHYLAEHPDPPVP